MADAELSEATRYLDWMRQGTELFGAAAGRVTDAGLAEPSRLPGWSRAHVLAHLARNADALVNLLTWARTGVETPMYASPESRDADIESTAGWPAPELRTYLEASAQRLDEAAAAMTAADWQHPVRTRQGREIAAAEVPWMRCREVWVHAVDLGTGTEFEAVPEPVAVALLSDVGGFMAARPGTPAVRIAASDADFVVVLGGDATTAGSTSIEAPIAELLPWLLGRSERPDWPALPSWL